MRIIVGIGVATVLALGSGCGRTPVEAEPARPAARTPATKDAAGRPAGWEVEGKTVPAPGCIARIATAVIHPVEEVKVVAGQRVKKDQILVEIDKDEPLADVEARKASLTEMQASLERLKREPRHEEQAEARAALESARISAEAASKYLDRLHPVYKSGALAEQRYHESVVNKRKSVADETAARARLARLVKRPFEWEVGEMQARINTAKANLDAAKAELEHYTLKAPIAGVISWLDVCPGTVTRPGTAVWGEILDLSQIDVRCDLTPAEADRLYPGQAAEVIAGKATFQGKVESIGIAADRKTGKVPALVRIKNANERLRCYVPVKVRFR